MGILSTEISKTKPYAVYHGQLPITGFSTALLRGVEPFYV